jgi:hypothetical protein
LDYYTLKNRLEDKAGKRVKAASSLAASTGYVETAFLELPPAASGLGECIVDLDSGDGAKMRVQLKGVEAPDLVALSRSFWDVES